ncbi:glycosyltransferase family 4 protein [Citrobacter braakii]|uniref:glycosyltransferase family 4 protein n=1 Tax=Citrobacter braakii TaxID=57706 RepID=UPI0022806FF2|nr:glycosyltransferase family 4 protein [Citrobacter braakii]MCY9797019.1 glycosyltransferase family 4 protein [Citrobacter braakii]
MKSKNKIVFIIADATCVGGIERVNVLLSNEFVKNYDVEIISLYKTNDSINYRLTPEVKLTFINKISYSGRPGSTYRLLNYLKVINDLNKYLMSFKDCFFIVNTFPLAVLSLISKIRTNNVYIVVEHVHANYYNFIFRQIRKVIYKFYDAIVALTDDDYKYYNKNHSNVFKINNPLSFNFVEKSKLNCLGIIAVGRLEQQKGFDLLIKAFEHIDPALRKGWVVDIYGAGGERDALMDMIANCHLENKVHLCGAVNNISEIYNKYSIFVFPSRFEGFGMVLVEAMASGLPCISFDCPTGPREILGNGEYGMLIENGNICEFSKALSSMMSDEVLREDYARKSVQRSKDFRISKIVNEWEILFMEVGSK